MKLGVKRLFFSALALFFLSGGAQAQFYTEGSDPGSLKWRILRTSNYKIIYPAGMDSLGRLYATRLEQVAPAVGSGSLYLPNEAYRPPMSVILHPYLAGANGMVTWAPRRMDLYTGADAFSPEPTPWDRQLAIHESRHVSQMQFAASRPFRFLKPLLGELGAGLGITLWGEKAVLEGDAVIAETALSRAGRGRSADFLEYYRASFAEGLRRDFYVWRHGSQKQFTPDHYALGYLTLGGVRAFYDAPDLNRSYYRRIADKGFGAFFNLQHTVSEATGMKFRESFNAVCDSLSLLYEAEAALRAPFLRGRRVSPSSRLYSEFRGNAPAPEGIYSVRAGLSSPREIVLLDPSGERIVKKAGLMGSGGSRLEYDSERKRLYWSELRSDIRYELRSYSDIRYLDSLGRKVTLVRGGRYYHPKPFRGKVVAVSYPFEGGSRVVEFDPEGKQLAFWQAPDSLQIVEAARMEQGVFASGITASGYGIWRVDEGFRRVLEPQPVKIKQLSARGGKLLFVCDRTGVNELYSLDPASRELKQLTSLEQGGSDFNFSPSGDSLYFSALRSDGRALYAVDADSLRSEPADWNSIHSYFIADKLSAGESLRPDYESQVQLSEPKAYSKALNLLKVHSWLPFYLDYDEIAILSSESLMNSLGLGATAFFQNELSTAYGSAGYHASKVDGRWKHAGHLRLTYKGLFPVINARLDLNSDRAYTYSVVKDSTRIKLVAGQRPAPRFSASVDIYLPLNFSRGGLSIGVVPRLSTSVNNDDCLGRPLAKMTGSLRAYAIEGIPQSRIFPRWGVGCELFMSARPWMYELMCANIVGKVYAYVPGLMDTHGIKLGLTVQRRLDNGIFCENAVNLLPRGYASGLHTALATQSLQTKFSFDYALPFAPVDWSGLSPVAYLRNFELTAHGDVLALRGPKGTDTGRLASAGLDLCARLSNLLWIPFPTRIGVEYNYLWGSAFEALLPEAGAADHHSLNLIFSVSF